MTGAWEKHLPPPPHCWRLLDYDHGSAVLLFHEQRAALQAGEWPCAHFHT